jgi:exopolysaccharide biosynthesis protein
MKKIGVFIITAMLFLSGCESSEESGVWKNIDDSISYRFWEFEVNELKESIEIYRINPEGYKITLDYSIEKPRYVSEWLYLNDGAEVVINGPYFNEDYRPSGYLKINNERIGELIFDQNLSGLVQIKDNKLSIRNLGKEALIEGEAVEFGLQSYPFLITNSSPALMEDTGKTARRSAIGTDAEGDIYLIIADTSHLTLYELMSQLIKTEIPFTEVLNLDGGTSTGIAVSEGNYHEIKDSLVKVPGVIVFDKI